MGRDNTWGMPLAEAPTVNNVAGVERGHDTVLAVAKRQGRHEAKGSLCARRGNKEGVLVQSKVSLTAEKQSSCLFDGMKDGLESWNASADCSHPTQHGDSCEVAAR